MNWRVRRALPVVPLAFTSRSAVTSAGRADGSPCLGHDAGANPVRPWWSERVRMRRAGMRGFFDRADPQHDAYRWDWLPGHLPRVLARSVAVSVDGSAPVVLTDDEFNYGLIDSGIHVVTQIGSELLHRERRGAGRSACDGGDLPCARGDPHQ